MRSNALRNRISEARRESATETMFRGHQPVRLSPCSPSPCYAPAHNLCAKAATTSISAKAVPLSSLDRTHTRVLETDFDHGLEVITGTQRLIGRSTA